MSDRLPARTDLTYLKRQGKNLLLGVRSREPAALSRVRKSLPSQRKNTLNSRNHDFGLRDALLVIAREYGFPSWTRLKTAVTHGLRRSLGDRLKVLSDPFGGTVATVTDGYDLRIESLQKRADQMEERLAARTAFLTIKFAAAERALAQLQSSEASLRSIGLF